MWSEEEQRQLLLAGTKNMIGGGDTTSRWLAVATRAVDLVAARGGTMTPDEVSTALQWSPEENDLQTARLRQHLAAQGARFAALEAENTGLSANLTEACRKADEQRERAEMAESAIAAERNGDAQMKADFGALPEETLRGMVARIAKERDAATQLAAHRLTGRMDAASEVERLRAERNACRGRAEDAEARLQRMRDGINDMVKRCVEMAKDLSVAIARGALGMPAKNVSVHNITPAMEDKGDEAHDNEQERSEALNGAIHEEGARAFHAGRDNGIEAMRAACLIEAIRLLDEEGLGHSPIRAKMKAAIEGATP